MAKRCNEKRVMAQSVAWGKRGARLNDIAPGIIVTPLAVDEFNGPRGGFLQKYVCKMPPAGRPGTADEVANVAELLMSDKGSIYHRLYLPDRRRCNIILLLWPAQAGKFTGAGGGGDISLYHVSENSTSSGVLWSADQRLFIQAKLCHFICGQFKIKQIKILSICSSFVLLGITTMSSFGSGNEAIPARAFSGIFQQGRAPQAPGTFHRPEGCCFEIFKSSKERQSRLHYRSIL